MAAWRTARWFVHLLKSRQEGGLVSLNVGLELGRNLEIRDGLLQPALPDEELGSVPPGGRQIGCELDGGGEGVLGGIPGFAPEVD